MRRWRQSTFYHSKGCLAQLAERLAYNEQASGSIPLTPRESVFTIKTSVPCTQLEALSGPYLLSQAEVTVAYTKIADMVELVDTLGLGPRGE